MLHGRVLRPDNARAKLTGLKEDGTRQYSFVYIEMAKKNGKSELAAGAALYHTFADGEMRGEIYGCAADKKQAKIVYKVAKGMIEMVPTLAKRAKVTDSAKTITDKVSGSIYQVLSAEAFTKHGLNLSACIFDELHAQPNRDLWDVMTFGAGDARTQPIWWILTTAGDDPDRVSVGWEQHDYAMRILTGEIVDPWGAVVARVPDGADAPLAPPYVLTRVRAGAARCEACRQGRHAARRHSIRSVRLAARQAEPGGRSLGLSPPKTSRLPKAATRLLY